MRIGDAVQSKAAEKFDAKAGDLGTPGAPVDPERPDQAACILDGFAVLRPDWDEIQPRKVHPWFYETGRRPPDLHCHIQRDGAGCFVIETPEQFARCIYLVPSGGYLNIGRHIELPGRCRQRQWTLVVAIRGRGLSIASTPYHMALASDPINAYAQILLVTKAVHMGERHGPALGPNSSSCCTLPKTPNEAESAE